MPKARGYFMKIYTKTGDKGKTGIFGGMRCDKDDIRIECNGILDEVVSEIGVLRTMTDEKHECQEQLFRIQVDMMDMMSHVATHSSMREKNTVNRPTDGPEICEKLIDEMMDEIDGANDYFVLPGGSPFAAQCHIIRARMRTAERRLISLHKIDPVEKFIMKYINRLSDYFFALSRYELYKSGYTEEKLRPFIMKF